MPKRATRPNEQQVPKWAIDAQPGNRCLDGYLNGQQTDLNGQQTDLNGQQTVQNEQQANQNEQKTDLVDAARDGKNVPENQIINAVRGKLCIILESKRSSHQHLRVLGCNTYP